MGWSESCLRSIDEIQRGDLRAEVSKRQPRRKFEGIVSHDLPLKRGKMLGAVRLVWTREKIKLVDGRERYSQMEGTSGGSFASHGGVIESEFQITCKYLFTCHSMTEPPNKLNLKVKSFSRSALIRCGVLKFNER